MAKVAGAIPVLCLLAASAAHAQFFDQDGLNTAAQFYKASLDAVQPIPGFGCMMLADPSHMPPVRALPSPNAPQIGLAAGIVLVHTTVPPENGFVQVLLFNGVQGWLPAAAVKPYRSASDPHARCVPAWMSDGKPRIGR